jgi:AdoMet-dependent rRNA methyltransferase SPB1
LQTNVRNVSAEIFVVCRGFKAPQKLDPKFLDPRSVFEELPDAIPNAEAKVFHPEKRKRQREGYEDGDYTFYKEETASAFIDTQDPIQMLSSTSRITWSDEASRKLRFKELTTKEILACCEDLKVLGKKDFRNLLKWRLAMREDLGLSTKEAKPDEPTETVTITEDDQIDAEMARLSAQDAAIKKRERRRLNERKTKEISRMQLGMLTPHELGMEQDAMDSDAIFGLKRAEQSGAMPGLLSGAGPEESEDETEDGETEGSEDEGNVDELEAELDTMYLHLNSKTNVRYNRFQERKAEVNAKFRAKRAREEVEEWDGLDVVNGGTEKQKGSGSDSDSDSDSEEDVQDPVDSLLTTLGPRLDERSKGKLSKRAALFFDQPDFEGIDEEVENVAEDEEPVKANGHVQENGEEDIEMQDSASENGFEIVPTQAPEPEAWDDDSDDEKPVARPSISFIDLTNCIAIDIVTAEAMTLAHQLVTRQKSKSSMVDDSYNRWTFADKSALPTWFADDESRHNTPQVPITAEAAAAIKEKLRALNARPIKKITEAKARKKMKAVRKLTKLQKKADVINETSDMSEREKAQSIAKVMAKGKRGEKRRGVKVVVAHGKNRGVSGRPKGVKGRYKMVDPRMKKEKRALKRAGKK